MANKIEEVKKEILEELEDDDHNYFHVRGKQFVCKTCEDLVESIIRKTAQAIFEDIEEILNLTPHVIDCYGEYGYHATDLDSDLRELKRWWGIEDA